jgi:hypothetical protein
MRTLSRDDVQVEDWAAIRTLKDVDLRPPAGLTEIEAASGQVGLRFPPDLVSMYQFCDGVYQPDGYLWIVWPLSDVVEQNEWLRCSQADFPRSMIAFGDFGLGEPFCIDPSTGSVSCWQPIEGLARPISRDLHAFWRGLVEGTIRI